MSSRVQKGSQKFRPVVNVRARAEGTPAPRKPPSSSKPLSSLKPPSQRTAPTSSSTAKENLVTTEALSTSLEDEGNGDMPSSPVLVRRNERPPQVSRSVTSSQIEHSVQSIASGPNVPHYLEALPVPPAEPTEIASSVQAATGQTSEVSTHNEPSRPRKVTRKKSISTRSAASNETPSITPDTTLSTVTEMARPADQMLSSEAPVEDDELDGRMKRTRRSSSRLQSKVTTQQGPVEDGHATNDRRGRRPKTKKELSPEPQPQENDDASEDSDDSEDAAPAPKRRRRMRKRRESSAPSEETSRRRRKTKEPLFSEDADPGEELDPTIITMADICADTGQGRISTKAVSIQRNHLAWKTANRAKRELMRATMEAKKYGRKEDDTEAGPTPSKEPDTDDNASQAESAAETPGPDEPNENGFDYRQQHSTNRFNAQIRIGANGETIVDEESLFVERADEEDASNQYQHVEESEQKKFTNSASYGKKPGSSRWSAEETDLFYDALQQFGENYELISYVLPGRDRKSCKSKFKLEDKKNPNRITYCLKNRRPYDIETLSRLTGKDFSGPTPELRMPAIPVPEASAQNPPPTETNGGDPPTTSNARKKSRTTAPADDVEVMGDVETFDPGFASDD